MRQGAGHMENLFTGSLPLASVVLESLQVLTGFGAIDPFRRAGLWK